MAKETMVFYVIPPDDVYPYERVGHFIKDHAALPPGAREIDADEAKRINDEVSARTPVRAAPGGQAPQSADLQPLLDKIDAIAKTVVSHAELHDQHQAKQVETDNKFDAQAKDISNVKVTTAKAISAALDGLGEKPA